MTRETLNLDASFGTKTLRKKVLLTEGREGVGRTLAAAYVGFLPSSCNWDTRADSHRPVSSYLTLKETFFFPFPVLI